MRKFDKGLFIKIYIMKLGILLHILFHLQMVDAKYLKDNFIIDYFKSNLKDVEEYRIISLHQSYIIDAFFASCDIKSTQNIKLKLDSPNHIINYIIISKESPIFGFEIKVMNDKSVFIIQKEIYYDYLFKERKFIDENDHVFSYQGRWIISVHLSHSVDEIELEISYYNQRAISIDNTDNGNIFQSSLVNPYNQDIEDYRWTINLRNFKNLKPENIYLPKNTKIIENIEKNIQLITDNKLPNNSEISHSLRLPLTLTKCEGDIVNLIFYGLVLTSLVIVVMSLITVSILYKNDI